jgi:hypothetical protein
MAGFGAQRHHARPCAAGAFDLHRQGQNREAVGYGQRVEVDEPLDLRVLGVGPYVVRFPQLMAVACRVPP